MRSVRVALQAQMDALGQLVTMEADLHELVSLPTASEVRRMCEQHHDSVTQPIVALRLAEVDAEKAVLQAEIQLELDLTDAPPDDLCAKRTALEDARSRVRRALAAAAKQRLALLELVRQARAAPELLLAPYWGSEAQVRPAPWS
jgi:hypothetical protein